MLIKTMLKYKCLKDDVNSLLQYLLFSAVEYLWLQTCTEVPDSSAGLNIVT